MKRYKISPEFNGDCKNNSKENWENVYKLLK